VVYLLSDNGSLYKKIIDDIIQGIQTGEFDSQLPTENELSVEYNVSRATVSKAMNELKENGIIVRYPGRGTFVSNDADTKIASYQASTPQPAPKPSLDIVPDEGPEFKQIVLIIPTIKDRFALSIITGIQEVLPPIDYHITIVTSMDANGEAQAIKHIRQSGASALVLFPVDQEYYSDEVLSMKLERFPFVLIDRPFPGIDTNYVLSDSYSGGQMAMRHLLDLGHRHIGFITNTGKSTYTVNDRIKGCSDVLETVSEDHSFVIRDELDTSCEYSRYGDMLSDLVHHQGVTAFIASETSVALYLYCALQSLSIDVPQSVSIVTFDAPLSDIEDFEFFSHVNQNPKQMGHYAGLIIRDILHNPHNTEQTTKKVIEPNLVNSRSTAPPQSRTK